MSRLDTYSSADRTARSRMALDTGSINAIKVWSVVGGLWLALVIYTMIKWGLSEGFKPTPPGDDPMSTYTRYAVVVSQILVPLLWLLIANHFLVKPWRRNREIRVEGLVFLAWSSGSFQDPLMSYTVNNLSYNAHLVNFGAWTAGIFPGWGAPNSQLIAEPVLVIFWSWALFAIPATMLVCTAMRAALRRFPSLGLPGAIFAAFLVLAAWDLVGETAFIRSGLCSYPGSIQSLSLWGGHYYQFPLYESATLGLALTMTTLLLYFRNDRGETWVERGGEQLTVKRPAKELMRFLAVVGFVNVAIMFCWTIPMQWIGTHADPYPEDLPSYLQKNMFCGPGTGYECPGPKVAMPRRN